MRKKFALTLLLGTFLINFISASNHQSPFADVGGQLVERIFSSIIWIGLGIIIIGALGGTMYYFLIYKRKFDIIVKIISERANDRDSIIFDKAAVLIDRTTKAKYFKLWDTKAELPVPPFNILQRTARGDYIELRRTAEDKWYFLVPPKIDRNHIMKSDGKIYPMSEQKTKMIDPDMQYWQSKRKSQNKGMFDPEKIWMKLLPYIPHIIGGFFIIFILYILMSHLPGILSQLRELTAELNRRSTADVTTQIIMPLLSK